MSENRYAILKLIFTIIFFLIGCFGAYFTFEMKNIVHFGNTVFETGSPVDNPMPIAGAGGGVDSSNDGVAIGLGIFSGLCILASSKLISQLK